MMEYILKFFLSLCGLTLCLMFVIVLVRGPKSNELTEKQQAWQNFFSAHHCKVIAHKEGYSSVGATSGVGLTTGGHLAVMSGSTDTETPSQTAYSCDDGVTYWRNNE